MRSRRVCVVAFNLLDTVLNLTASSAYLFDHEPREAAKSFVVGVAVLSIVSTVLISLDCSLSLMSNCNC